MLSAAEFEERAGKAPGARVRRELNALVIDLPVRLGSGTVPGASPEAPAAADEVELRGSFSSLKRRGNWTVPRKLVLRRRMGSTELDFTEARIEHAVVEIELDITVGSVELRLPEGASATLDDIDVTLGSVNDHRRHAPADGRPHFTVAGEVRMGSVELRGPQRWWRRGW